MDFIIIDTDSCLRPLWEGMGDTAPTDAAPEAFRRIIAAREGFDRVLLALDVGRSFRTIADPLYKSDRVPPSEAYRHQRKALVERVRRAIGATAWWSPPIKTSDGSEVFGEADDVIAGFVQWYRERTAGAWKEGVPRPLSRLRILSGDTDMWALVDDALGIDVRMPDGTIVTEAAVVERFGVPPALVPEVRALAGDDSDHYKPFRHPEKTAGGASMPGIGVKTAATIVLGPRDGDDVCGTDRVMRAIVAGTDPGLDLPANVLTCLRHGGFAALERGRACAFLMPHLVITASGTAPLDYSKVLDEPVIRGEDAPKRAPVTPPPAEAPRPSVALAVIPPGSLRDLAYQRTGLDPFALEPTDLDSAMYFAGEMFASGLFPKLPNAASVLTLVARARVHGIPAVMAPDYFDFIEGRATWTARGMLAVVQAHHSCVRLEFDWSRCNETQAVLMFQRAGQKAGEYPFTMDMAKKAGYVDGKSSKQWLRRPGVMLRWACVRELVRVVWGDLLGGLYARDEDEDLPEAIIE